MEKFVSFVTKNVKGWFEHELVEPKKLEERLYCFLMPIVK